MRANLTVPSWTVEVDEKKSPPPKGGKPSPDDNLIVHGDNLHALKALMPRYAGRVNCIYVDPPYSAGKEWLKGKSIVFATHKFMGQKELTTMGMVFCGLLFGANHASLCFITYDNLGGRND